MQTIFTIGTQSMNDDTFIAILKTHGIDAIIDIRLRNEGRYYRFASGKHIKALVEAHGIAYRHETRFAPTKDMLTRYRNDCDWPAYEQAYATLIQERDMVSVWQEAAGESSRPCLLCAEKDPAQCHRRLLAEHMATQTGAAVEHLQDSTLQTRRRE